jgi:hypothetical protein
MDAWGILRKIKDIWSWIKFAADILGALGILAIVTGLGASIGGGVWAMITGVPIPIAIMAAYCTFVGMVYLAIAPAAFRILTRTPTTQAALQDDRPNYEAWKHVDVFTIQQAAHLWCDLDPNRPGTLDTAAWQRALGAAIQKGELKSKLSGGVTIITRESLKEFGKKHRYDRKFLRD